MLDYWIFNFIFWDLKFLLFLLDIVSILEVCLVLIDSCLFIAVFYFGNFLFNYLFKNTIIYRGFETARYSLCYEVSETNVK